MPVSIPNSCDRFHSFNKRKNSIEIIIVTKTTPPSPRTATMFRKIQFEIEKKKAEDKFPIESERK